MKSDEYDKAKSPIISKSLRTKNSTKQPNSLRFSYKDKKD